MSKSTGRYKRRTVKKKTQIVRCPACDQERELVESGDRLIARCDCIGYMRMVIDKPKEPNKEAEL